VPRPVGVSSSGRNILLSIPTVIGGHYSIEGTDRIDKADKSLEQKFDGDGTVQTKSIPATNSESYFRVNGY